MTAPEHVLWIGGRSGSGKSTVARLLARRHGLRWYSCDTRTWDHRDRAIAAGDAGAIEWEEMPRQQRSQLSADDAIRLAIDRSDMVRSDVAALPEEPAVVAEGTNIVPSMVPDASAAVWLVADPSVRAARTRVRGWGAGGGEHDRIMESELSVELREASSAVIDTSDHVDPRETMGRVEDVFTDWLRRQPAGRGLGERQALIRHGNAAIVAQYRGGMDRAGNTSGGGLVRTYDCECGARDCVALIERTLDSLPDPFTDDAPAILAPGHRG